MKTTRLFNPGDRYVFDFELCRSKDGWAQVDTSQDASYFGTWANPLKLKIVSYIEGDITIKTTDKKELFVAELVEMERWNNENDYGFAIDCLCNKKIINEFENMGLVNMLH